MSPVNEHGQPVGHPVPGWTGCRPPQRAPLDGRYVRLEPVGATHVPDLYAALCSPEDDPLWTYRAEDRPGSESELAERVAGWSAREPDVTFAVLPAGGGAGGLATLMRVDPDHGSAEVGSIIFGRALQRTRAATEAIHLLARHLFDDLGYRRFEWKLDALNAPSATAARRLGFTYEGRFRNALVHKGRNRDTDWFAMTSEEWPRLRALHERWLDPDNFDAAGRQRLALSTLVSEGSAVGR